jgi:hypothetical protein
VIVGNEKIFVGLGGLAEVIHASHSGHPDTLGLGGRLKASLPL